MNKYTNKYVQDYLANDNIGIFLTHRRVMTLLYKRTGLTGYQIELVLLINKLTNQDSSVCLRGSEIRRRCSKRFQCVLNSIIALLVDLGYITDSKLPSDRKQAWHYINITQKGIDFYYLWKQTLEELLKEERDLLIIAISDGQKRDKNKSKIYKRKVW